MKHILTILILFSSLASAEPVLTIKAVEPEPDSQKVKVRFTVTSPEKYCIKNIDEETVHLFEDNFRVNYVRIERDAEANKPVYSLVLVDTYCRSGDSCLLTRKNFIKTIMSHVQASDKVAIYSLSSQVRAVAGFNTNRKEKLFALAEIERTSKPTISLNYIYESISLFKDVKSPNKRIIVVSDCPDYSGSVSAEDLVNSARENGVSISFVSASAVPRKSASRIAKLTGGDFYAFSDFRDESSFKKITMPQSIGYAATYISMQGNDGKSHSVELRLYSGEVRDRSRGEFNNSRRIFDVERLLKTDTLFHAIMTGMMLLILSVLFFIVLKMVVFKRKDSSTSFSQTDKENQFQELSIDSAMHSTDRAGRFEYAASKTDELIEHVADDQIYSSAWLIIKGDSKNEKIAISGDISIGSDSGNNIVLSDKSVSSKHASIRKIKEGFFLFDLVSDSGVILNGKKLLRPRALFDWDEIVIGKTRIIFRGANLAIVQD